MHWSAQLAAQTIRRGSDPVVVASGISLSGPVHVGHSREFLTAGLMAHQLVQHGQKVRFIAFADDLDPLRKVYPFLPDSFARWVGCPLNMIPDAWGCHESYAEHFLDQLVQAFSALGLQPEVLRSSEFYQSGQFTPLVKRLLSARRQISQIIQEVTSGQPASDEQWYYQPVCPICQSITGTRVTAWNDGDDKMSIWCRCCEKATVIDLRQGNGKLAWRCDWPMRWAYLGVDIEPFGHDHSSAGGSYQSGVRIAHEVLGIEPPVPIPYGWIHFREGGAMHSSSGKAISITELAACYPPESIWWMIARNDPVVTIKFDPVRSLLDETRLLRQAANTPLTDEDAEAANIVREIVGVRPDLVAYPWDHLLTAAQIGRFDEEATLRVLHHSVVYQGTETPLAKDSLRRIARWIETYGQEYRLQVRDVATTHPLLTDEEERVRRRLTSTLDEITWEAEPIHQWVRDSAGAEDVSMTVAFQTVYKLILAQTHGPKVGWFLETLGREMTRQLVG